MPKPEIKIEAPQYTPDELEFRNLIIQHMESSREQRAKTYAEFDDMNYRDYYISNIKARNGYLRPKVNEEDVRVTSGVTKEKVNSLLAYLLNLNLEADIESFDKNNRKEEKVAEVMEDLVKKSYIIEPVPYDAKRIVIYDEFLTQGDCFVEDKPREWSVPDLELTGFNKKLDDITWKSKMDKVYKFCETNLIIGLNVYLGNIREPFIEKQPFIVTRRLLSRAEAYCLYGDWERWANVPLTVAKVSDHGEDSESFNDWCLEQIDNGYVEDLDYYCKWTNTWMKLLNGVMMFPVRRNKETNLLETVPLSSINGIDDYPISQGSYQKRTNFAYSKSIPASVKVDQAIFDEMLKAIVLKTRKSSNPPIANNTGKTLSRKIFQAATIHNGLNPDKIKEIGNNGGVTSAEFQAATFIKEIIDGKSMSPIFEGQALKGQQTAREIIELKQQSMMKAGLSILGLIQLESRLKWLRIHSIIKNWTDPIDKRITVLKDDVKTVNQYKSLTVDTTFAEGDRGERRISFVEDQSKMPTDQQVYAGEKAIKQATGKNVRINHISVKDLTQMRFTWFINIVPTEKDSGMLKAAKFEEFVEKILKVLAPLGKMPNIDYIAERLAIVNGEDPEKFFPAQQEQAMPQAPQEAPQEAPNQLGAQMNKPMSMNALMQG